MIKKIFIFIIMKPIARHVSYSDVKSDRYSNNHKTIFKTFDWARAALNESNCRINTIEQKCLGLVQYTAVVTGLLCVILTSTQDNITFKISLLLSFLLAIFSVILGSYGMKVHTVWSEDFHEYDDSSNNNNDVILNIGKYSYYNNNVADFKADILKCAQIYFISSLVVAVFLIIFFVSSTCTSTFKSANNDNSTDKIIGTINGNIKITNKNTEIDGKIIGDYSRER